MSAAAVIWSVAALLAAYAVAVSPSAMRHNADSLIPIFVSLESWSPFYWGQDRFGMLTALIALPIRDSFANLVVQNTLNVALLLGGLAAAFTRVGWRAGGAGALVVLAAIVVTGQSFVAQLLTTQQSYAPALGCFGLALAFCRDPVRARDYGLALLLMIIGGWANSGVALLVLMIASGLVLLPTFRTAALQMAFGAGVSVVVHRVLQQLADVRNTYLLPPSVSEIPALLVQFWTQLGILGPLSFWGIAALVWMAALMWPAGKPRETRLALVITLVTAVAFGCFMAVMFKGRSRYLAPVLPLALAVPLAALAANRAAAARSAVMRVIGAIALVVIVLLGFRWPGEVRRGLVAHLGGGAAERLVTERVDVVTGDYWRVWPMVFAANVLHEQEGRPRQVMPVAFRSEPLRARLLERLGGSTAVAVVPATDLEYWKSNPDLPVLDVENTGGPYALGRPRLPANRAALVR